MFTIRNALTCENECIVITFSLHLISNEVSFSSTAHRVTLLD